MLEEEMTARVSGKLIGKRTLLLDRPLKADEKEVVVKLRKEPVVKTKIDAPEDVILELADKDVEELS